MSEVHFYRPEAPESIWIDRGPNGGWMFRTEKLHDSVRQYVPADRIEALTAENERLRGLFAALAIDPDACAVARQYARAALAEPRA